MKEIVYGNAAIEVEIHRRRFVNGNVLEIRGDFIHGRGTREIISEKLAKRFGLKADRAEAYYVKAEAALAQGK